MFERSLKRSDTPSGSLSLSVKPAADNSPSLLRERLAAGQDVMSIWFLAENAHVIAENALLIKDFYQKMGVKSVPSTSYSGSNVSLSHHEMSVEDILDFCKTIKVHPAHLVPFSPDRTLSLPSVLLETLIHIRQQPEKFSVQDIHLAHLGIEVEAERIKRFLNTKQKTDITEIFSNVLKNSEGLKKLLIEYSRFSQIFNNASVPKPNYPLVSMVRNVAYVLEDQLVQEAQQRVTIKEEKLLLKFKSLREEYDIIQDKNLPQNDAAWYLLGDIRDALFTKGKEPHQASLDDVQNVVMEYVSANEILEKAYHTYMTLFESPYGFDGMVKDHTENLSTDIHHYFRIEADLVDAKQNLKTVQDSRETRMNKIKTSFESAFVEGSLYQQIMNNAALIDMNRALTSGQFQMTPK